MNVAQMPARPPYVEFKRVAVHDKEGSVVAGYRKTKDVDMAYIMQPGSRDVHEKKAEDWLASIKFKILNGSADAFPQEWVDGFHRKFDAWKQGLEAPLDGTSVREWPFLSPAQAENLITLRILTIEDAAEMTEEAMGRYGMGGRELRNKAREWVKGKEISDSAMKENVALRNEIAELRAQVESLQKEDAPRRGRPPKQEAA